MNRIEAVFVRDWVEPYAKEGGGIPVVEASTHPRFGIGARLDYGAIQIALKDGYDISIRQLRAGDIFSGGEKASET